VSQAAILGSTDHAVEQLEAPHLPPTLAQQTSVVVVAYNSGHLLRDCVSSVLGTEPEVEVVIVDNASADDAVSLVEAEYPAVRTVRSEENLGFGVGNNLGAAQANRAFLVFLNHDAVVTDGWLEALAGPLVEDPSLGLVTPKVLLRNDPEHINVAGLKVHLSGISMCRGLDAERNEFDEEAEVAAISGVAFAVRRDLFQALGGFGEDFFLYMEDVDLSLRTWLAGYRCLYLPRGVVLHEYTEVEVDTPKTFWVERGRYLMLLKAFEARTLLALLPTLFLVEGITCVWILWRNPRALGQKLRAWSWVLAHRGQIADQRREVQANRAVPDAVFLSRCQWELDFAQLSGPRMARAANVVLGPLLRGAAWLLDAAVVRRKVD
jgi:GT2 family glycosyltransferase